MTRVDPRSGAEVIDHDGCLALLGGESVGRLAIIEGTGPLVLPINFALHGDRVVFRTGPGSKLAASRSGRACFELDRFEAATRSGWSVVVRGRLEEVQWWDRDYHEIDGLLGQPWLPVDRPNLVRLVPAAITGRLLRPVTG